MSMDTPIKVKYLKKPTKLNWRTTGHQDPSEGEDILVIDPTDNEVRISSFCKEEFSIPNIKWWLRLDDIPKPD